ncbi:SNF2-related protein [Microbacterium yannicii]|uniref:SNF2-related protein n=1 Tax=Microbacterium yannicii TaxID=671622 RepID=UPI0002FD2655|nr:SNF2-related protein [Microbacterium yannicii]
MSEWLTLDDVESSLLWPHLATAPAHGIPLVATKRSTTVAVAGDARVAVVARPSTGGLEIATVVAIDGEPADPASVRAIGRSGVYRFAVHGERIDLTLAAVPLADPVPALLASKEPVTVPDDEAGEFVAVHLPRIARRVAVEAPGIDVPPPTRPTLVVSVRFAPSHRLDYELAWRYGETEPLGYDAPDTAGDRDERAEHEIRARIEALWRDASPVGFAAAGSLTGLDAAEFATHLLPPLESAADVLVQISGTRPRYRELTGDPRIEVTTVESADADWFDLGVVVSIDGRRIPFASLFTALARGRKKLLLSDGAYFSLSHPSLGRLRDLIEEASELDEWEAGPRISRHQTDLWADFEDVADEAMPAVSWRATVEALRSVDAIPPSALPTGLQAELRPYQRAGYDWLAFLWTHRLGGILADDMGLGKTLQMLSLVAKTRDDGERRPFLVVAPTSVLSTWRSEAARFNPRAARRGRRRDEREARDDGDGCRGIR